MEILLVLVIGGLAAAGWVYFGHLEKKRRQRVIDLAKELQLELNWELPEQDRAPFQRFELSKKGRRPHTSLVLVADDEVTRIVLFDYSFTTGSGKNQQTHHWVVALCRDARLRAPAMSLKPETLFAKIGSLIGYQDIEIPDDPVFSKAFTIQGTDEEAIRKYLDAERRNALMVDPKLTYALDQDYCVVIRQRKKLDAPFIKPLLGESLKLVTALVGPDALPE